MANNINLKKKDYSKTKIYMIESIMEHPPEHIYYGSTTKQYLSQRMSTHRGHYKSFKTGKGHNFYTLFELIDMYGLNNMKIYLVENYPCNTKDEKASREGYYIRHNPCINKNIPGRTKKELHQLPKYKDYKKKYQQTPKCKEYNKKYQKNYHQTSQTFKDYQKQYMQQTKYKDYQREYQKQYREKKKQEKENNTVLYDADNEVNEVSTT